MKEDKRNTRTKIRYKIGPLRERKQEKCGAVTQKA